MNKENQPLYIDGKWTEGKGNLFSSLDPATEKILWEGKAASAEQINYAVSCAKQAFTSWAKTPIETRKNHLTAYKNILIDSKKDLAHTISLEVGKPLWESLEEVQAMINKIEISFKAYEIRCNSLKTTFSDTTSLMRHKPHGQVAIIGPYNFPAHLPNGHMVPALLAGNTIVFKPSEKTPLSAIKMIECFEKAGFPKGVINLVQGDHRVAEKIIDHPNINGIFFTGSFAVGKILLQKFALQPEKILALEMGGNNPYIVSNISDVYTASFLTIQSAYATSGQRCTCARRLIVPKGKTGDLFIETLIEKIKNIKVGAFTEAPEPFMGPLISKTAYENLLKDQENLIQLGASPLVKMEPISRKGFFLTPGLLDVTKVKNLPDKEYFGPLLQLIRVKDFEQALTVANQTIYGLAAGLLSEDKDQWDDFYHHIQAGVVNWNTKLTGASSRLAFGGIKKSGNFRPSAFYAADYCAYPVASMERLKPVLPKEKPPGINF